ncbi:MAG: gamma-glutamyl-gamma-aminobutyrate hydrolase family protein [Alphaproteobacteria bacterium]|nr:gamma-glutamyl-gamma-aminobutyrate hydrolase family protein [Alphaproteobacteria bacterium]
MAKTKTVYLEYLPQFSAYGIAKDVISKLKDEGFIADIRLPESETVKSVKNAPTMGFLLGQDKDADGKEYYSIGQTYLTTLLNTGANLKFLDYENSYKQMSSCHGAILPGGAFSNPESFYIDGKTLGDKEGKRYFAYRAVIAEAYKKHKPLLGICAGAQMIGALLGGMKMYRNLREEIPHPAVHKPQSENDVRIHRIKLLKNSPLSNIMGLPADEEYVLINSRHNQSMVHSALQDYVDGEPKVKMTVYAISDDDGIPEIWGNDDAGILCVQGHPEDLAAVGDKKMQKLYDYVVQKSLDFKQKQAQKTSKSKLQNRQKDSNFR